MPRTTSLHRWRVSDFSFRVLQDVNAIHVTSHFRLRCCRSSVRSETLYLSQIKLKTLLIFNLFFPRSRDLPPKIEGNEGRPELTCDQTFFCFAAVDGELKKRTDEISKLSLLSYLHFLMHFRGILSENSKYQAFSREA